MTGHIPTDRPYTMEEALEYQRQMLVWGDVLVDADSRPLPRETPVYWREIRIGGRGHGKSYLQRLLNRVVR